MRSIKLAGALLAIALPFSAHAAPQMLGLAATPEALPLVCEDGKCTAELSSFCLQEARDEPRYGTTYKMLRTTAVTLTFTLRDGSKVTRPAKGLVHLVSGRDHFAVRLSMPQSVMRKMGATEVAVRVGTRVSLVPKPVPGDKTPLTRAEIDKAANSLRATAESIVDGEEPDAVAARVMNRMINLSAQGDISRQQRLGVWARATKGAKGGEGVQQGLRTARQLYSGCHGHHPIPGNFAQCLQKGHDRVMDRMNKQYWRITGAGS